MTIEQRVYQAKFRGEVNRHGEAKILLHKSGEIVLVKRGKLRSVVMVCPCGCGEEIVINLDPRVGPAWRLYRTKKKVLTIFPSVWRESGCGSHFIVWDNKIYWCDYDSLWDETLVDSKLDKLVLKTLNISDFLPYKEVAEKLGEIPWAVLLACRRLVESGLIHEGHSQFKGYFRRLEKTKL